MAIVLCTGADPVLMETRKLILEQAGHTVITANGKRALSEACNNVEFDVVIIGQGISRL